MFNTQGVLKIAEAAEADTAKKKTRGRPHKRNAKEDVEEDVEELLENLSSDSDHDCIVVAMHK